MFEKEHLWSGDFYRVDSISLGNEMIQEGTLTCLKYCFKVTTYVYFFSMV